MFTLGTGVTIGLTLIPVYGMAAATILKTLNISYIAYKENIYKSLKYPCCGRFCRNEGLLLIEYFNLDPCEYLYYECCKEYKLKNDNECKKPKYKCN